LRPVAELASLALALAGTRAREHAFLLRLQALDAARVVLLSERALDRVLQRIVEVVVQIAGARYGALGIAGPDGYLTDFITTGLTLEERARIGQLPRGEGLLGVLIREGQPLRVPAIQQDPRRVGFPPGHPPMTSLLGVPIRIRDEVVGDLYLTEKIGAPAFSDEDQELIELLAVHAGVAIEIARLYAQVHQLAALQKRVRRTRELHDAIIQDIYAAMLRIENLALDRQDPVRLELLSVASALGEVIRPVARRSAH
jgi:GAF domain-containing protein